MAFTAQSRQLHVNNLPQYIGPNRVVLVTQNIPETSDFEKVVRENIGHKIATELDPRFRDSLEASFYGVPYQGAVGEFFFLVTLSVSLNAFDILDDVPQASGGVLRRHGCDRVDRSWQCLA